MKLSKNKKKFYASAVFKIDVLKMLLNALLFDKIALEISVFDVKVYEYVFENLLSDSKKIELTDDKDFGEYLKLKKSQLKLEKKLEKNSLNVSSENDEIFKFDKCIICDEYLSKVNLSYKNKTYADYSSSSEDYENQFNFNSVNCELVSNFNEDFNYEKNNNLNQNSEDISKVRCPFCKNELHTICFAELLLEESINLIPKEGTCLVCFREYKWSEFLQIN